MPEKKAHNRLNQGFDIKIFGIAVIAAILLIIFGIFLFIAVRGGKNVPKANQPRPNSRLVLPSSEQSRTA